MNNTRLPPLNALRAFEAVARHQSFRKAAEELFVTPAAITHQIKSLETQLGVQLFERLNRRIRLTEAAEAALPRIRDGFTALYDGVTELRRHVAVPRLTIGASPTFVSRWLMPRLQGFLSLHPEIDVSLVASGRIIAAAPEGEDDPPRDNGKRDIDVDIRFSAEPPADADLLFAVQVVPMCHPRRLRGPPPLQTPEDLRFQTLLHGDGRQSDRSQSAWARWLRLAQVSAVDPRRGLQLEHSTLALEAAVDGLGVTLAMPMLAAAELTEAKLAIAFPIALPLNSAYYLMASRSGARRPEISAFRDWLIAEARAAALAFNDIDRWPVSA